MVSEKVRKLRENVLSELSDIVETSIKVGKEMEDVPHPRGMAYRSLKPKSGMFVIHSDDGVSARYQHTDGQWYQININKIHR
jgi:hypothetical protein